ncbi:MAG TPA: hypothetical protein VJZ03_04675, partial [Candidatus Bathyarchaeia archaeon]|nr:hypothetical protein [Candidatus Bathyarchaeia archaeon]
TETPAIRKTFLECYGTSMDVEAIARRIAQDHGVTVLEKDVIETLEKLKAANEKKNTPPVTNALPMQPKTRKPPHR